MSIETVYQALGAIVVAIPIIVVVGTAALLAAGGVIGCTKCLLVALTTGSEPVTEPARRPAHGKPGLA